MNRILRCYAEGHEGAWEAICLDLDIAVQGASFGEVFESLQQAIGLYVDSLSDLPEDDRRRLLMRKAPMGIRLKFLSVALKSLFRDRDRDGHSYHQFTVPAAA